MVLYDLNFRAYFLIRSSISFILPLMVSHFSSLLICTPRYNSAPSHALVAGLRPNTFGWPACRRTKYTANMIFEKIIFLLKVIHTIMMRLRKFRDKLSGERNQLRRIKKIARGMLQPF